MRVKGLNTKKLLRHIPEDGVLLIFNGVEASWRDAAYRFNRDACQVHVCDYRLPTTPGRKIRPRRRDMMITLTVVSSNPQEVPATHVALAA